MKSSQSPLDQPAIKNKIIGLIQKGESNTFIAREVGTSEKAIRTFRKRHGIQIPGVNKAYTKINGDEAEAAVQPVTNAERLVLDDPDKMLRDRGLDPEEWYIDVVIVNEWDGPQAGGNVVTYYQAKFTAKRKKPESWLQPVRSDGWKPKVDGNLHPWIPPYHEVNTSELVVVCGDQQAPFYDKKLHKLFLDWLSFNRPSQGIILGDLIDFPDISRHPSDPDNVASVQECLQVGYEIVRDYVAASPRTQWQLLLGNHDIRLERYIIEKAPYIHGLSQVTTTSNPTPQFIHSLIHLMRLDELRVELVVTNGSYEDAQIAISDKLAVRHGWLVNKGSGMTALKTLEKTHYSIIVGHVHRQSIIYHTVHDIDRSTTTLTGVEAGCMCRIDGKIDESGRRFPSYSVLPDWQQGFCSVQLWDDGKFKVDLAAFVSDTLLWRDQRYDA